ncbi:MAG: DUF1064 domain-containing protein [Bacteroidota bacterium]
MRRKFGNKPMTVDGVRFDSHGEYFRWLELQALEREGVIRNLERQITVPLVVNGTKVCALRPDFAYFENGKRVYDDFKGHETRDWRIKWKLAQAIFPNIEWRVSKGK